MNHKFWVTASRVNLHMQFTGLVVGVQCLIESPNIVGKYSKTNINYELFHFQLIVINGKQS